MNDLTRRDELARDIARQYAQLEVHERHGEYEQIAAVRRSLHESSVQFAALEERIYGRVGMAEEPK